MTLDELERISKEATQSDKLIAISGKHLDSLIEVARAAGRILYSPQLKDWGFDGVDVENLKKALEKLK